MAKNPKLSDKWFRTLPPDAHSAVRSLIELADQAGVVIYLVGGPLRDTLLSRPSLDIDLAVEGDAPSLALALGQQLSAPVTAHQAFGTATLRSRGWHIDLATARTETYRQPGALPHVTPATINDDLRRRDFTINAMAMCLNGPTRGSLLDPHGGIDDLHSCLIRALHKGSFRDDATRIFRAARYEARFGFQVEGETLGWIRRDVPFIQTISGTRLHHEFVHIFSHGEPERVLQRLDELGALRAIHPALTCSEDQGAAFAWLRANHPHALPAAAWPLLAYHVGVTDAPSVSKRLALTRAQSASFEAMPALRRISARLAASPIKRSDVVALLAAFPLAAVWALAAALPAPVQERCTDYLLNGRFLQTALRGERIIELGVPQGPRVGEVLRRLRVAKLDGDVKTRRDEERYVRELLAEASQR